MKILGLDLDNSAHIATDKSLRYAQNISIDSKNQSYFNEKGFDILGKLDDILKNNSTNDTIIPNIYNDAKYHKYNIIGTIPTNVGIVLFSVIEYWNNENKDDLSTTDAIIYITFNNNEPLVERCIYSNNGYLNFSIDRPIHGDYIYNYEENLIIAFTEGTNDDCNETRIINITNPLYDSNNGKDTPLGYNIQSNESSIFNLIPDVIFPTLKCSVEDGGNLKTGAYQISIKYKLNDGTYTNYSPLSLPLIVCSNYEEDYPLGIEINKNITIKFNVIDNKYKTFKLAIIYIDDESQLSYESDDITIVGDTVNYIVSDLSYLNSISLDDIFIKNISYIKDKTLTNFNNRLIRGNVKTLNYNSLEDSLKEIASGIKVKVKCENQGLYLNTTKRYFKSNEVYVLYIGFYDYKGDLINIYNIPANNSLGEGYTEEFISGDVKGHLIPEKIQNYDSSVKPDLSEGVYAPNLTYEDIKFDDNVYRVEGFEAKYYDFRINTFVGDIDHYSVVRLSYYGNVNISYTEDDFVKKGLSNFINNSTHNIILVNNHNKTPIKVRLNINVKISRTSVPDKDNERSQFYLLGWNITDQYKTNTLNLDSQSAVVNVNRLISPGETTIVSKYYDIEVPAATNSNSGQVAFIWFLNTVAKTSDNNPHSTFITSSITKDVTKNYIHILYPVIDETKLPKEVKSYNFLFIEHNLNNSRVLSQAFTMQDTGTNNFSNSQEYADQFNGSNYRFYPFEFLYNKINTLNVKLLAKYINSSALSFIKEVDTKGFEVIDSDKGIKYLDIDLATLNQIERKNEFINSVDGKPNFKLEYINANNSSQNNTAGDSYYRAYNLKKSLEKTYSNIQCGIIELINDSNTLYSDVYSQKLQIASELITNTNASNKEVKLEGDTFLSYLTLRATTPSTGYRYGVVDDKEKDSNGYVWRWIFTVPIESKFNILARFSNNNVDKVFKLSNSPAEYRIQLYKLNYQIDNFINTDVGKGYSPIYNENGIETFIYYENIPGVQDHPYRIIRSQLQSSENINLNWRLFKSNDYKDMPFNRGEIISLKSDNKNLYIQQLYGLHLLQQRDTLSNTDEGTSYLGTSDIFNMEPQELIYSPTGYIGCESYYDTCITAVGYFVIDVIHKKIFNISGSKINNISSINVKNWFKEHLKENAINPFKNNGRYWVYNEDSNILYLVQNIKDNNFTLSYSPILNCWLSFHTYNPIIGCTNRNGLFWFDNNRIYSISKTNFGRYLQIEDNDIVIHPSIIKFILNNSTQYNKLLNTISWKDRVDLVKNIIPSVNYFTKTINSILVHTDDQCTNYNKVDFNNKWYSGSTGVNKINLWRFNNINDIHKSIPFMIDDITIDENAIKNKPKWYDVNKIISQFIYCIMKFNNDNNNELWELIDISPEWNLDNRNNQN